MFFGAIALTGVLSVVGAVFVKKGFKYLRLYNKVKNLATSKIQSLAVGDVEVKGKISSNSKSPLISPVTQTPCISYHFDIYKYVKKKKGGSWEQIFQEVKNQSFYLSDDTGHILVNPEGAIVRSDISKVQYGSSMFPATYNMPSSPEMQEMKNRINAAFGGMAVGLSSGFGRNYKYVERIIPENDDIYVLGYTVPNNNRPDDEKIQRLMIQDAEGHDFLITCEKEKDLQKEYFLKIFTYFVVGVMLVIFGLLQIINIIDWIGFMGGFQ